MLAAVRYHRERDLVARARPRCVHLREPPSRHWPSPSHGAWEADHGEHMITCAASQGWRPPAGHRRAWPPARRDLDPDGPGRIGAAGRVDVDWETDGRAVRRESGRVGESVQWAVGAGSRSIRAGVRASCAGLSVSSCSVLLRTFGRPRRRAGSRVARDLQSFIQHPTCPPWPSA